MIAFLVLINVNHVPISRIALNVRNKIANNQFATFVRKDILKYNRNVISVHQDVKFV